MDQTPDTLSPLIDKFDNQNKNKIMINDSFHEDENIEGEVSPRDINLDFNGNSMFNRQPSKASKSPTMAGDNGNDDTNQADISGI